MVLANRYVDDVIIGAPLYVTEDLIKTFNIQIVAQSDTCYEEMNEYLRKLEFIGDPYAVPKQKGIFQLLKSDVELSTEVICKRIIENRERQMQRFKKGSAKNQKYYQSQKEYVVEIA